MTGQAAMTPKFWDAYQDWATYLQAQDAARTNPYEALDWQPIFVRSDLASEDFFRVVDEDYAGVLKYDLMERHLNDPDLRGEDQPLEAVLYHKIGGGIESAPFTVMHVGAPVDIECGGHGSTTYQGAGSEMSDMGAPLPVLAVIDDGIGFMNYRFRSGHQTRFSALWVQALAQQVRGEAAHVNIGKVYEEASLNLRFCADQLDAREAYRTVIREVFPEGLEHDVLRSSSHGTHILDVAGGADAFDPGDPMRQVRLLGVQLPPQSVDDTSGQHLITPILQAVRWLVWTSHMSGCEKLVINLSYGILAGAKDGNSFFEQQLQREINRYRAVGLERKPLEVTLVVPFGNDYQHRQVARLAPQKDKPAALDMVLRADDQTPSYVEIRPLPAGSGDAELSTLIVSVTAPCGKVYADLKPDQGDWADLVKDGMTIARLYHIPPHPLPHGGQTAAYLALAFAPTASVGGTGPLALCGRWGVTLTTTQAEPQDIVLQIQRDDAVSGTSIIGRQAYFDDSTAYDPDPKTGNYARLANDSPIVYRGTNSAYAGVEDAHIIRVGAARQLTPAGGPNPVFEPAAYTSAGADWTAPHPDISAAVETSTATVGVLASGIQTGSTARYYGTSVAAALYSRNLLLGTMGKGPKPELENAVAVDRLGERIIPA